MSIFRLINRRRFPFLERAVVSYEINMKYKLSVRFYTGDTGGAVSYNIYVYKYNILEYYNKENFNRNQCKLEIYRLILQYSRL